MVLPENREKSFKERVSNIEFSVRSGITGLAQISGRNKISWEERLEFDIQYIKNKSLSLDIEILFKILYN